MTHLSRDQDKLVLNISLDEMTRGKDTYQLFSMLPGVMILNDEIQINTSLFVTIFVNGKPSKLGDEALKNYLKTLSAQEILKIEKIDNPSAEYAANINGSILNVVLAETKRSGISGSIGFRQSFGLGKYPSSYPFVSSSIVFKRLQ